MVVTKEEALTKIRERKALENPLKINGRHRQLMMELATGAKVKDAALRVGLTPERASQLINSPLFSEEFALMQEEIRLRFVEAEGEKFTRPYAMKRLSEEVPASITALTQIRDSVESPASARVASARDLLDRAGYKPTEKHELATTITAPEGLVDMIRAAASSAASLKEAKEKESA